MIGACTSGTELPPDMTTRSPDARQQAAAASIKQLRARLLDLTGRNPLISFSHGRSAGMRTHVRAVNGRMDALFADLAEGKPLVIRPVPPPDHALEIDEKPILLLAGPAQPGGEQAAASIGTREASNRPSRTEPPSALSAHATRLGIDPSFDLRPSEPGTASRPTRGPAPFQTLVLPDTLERQLTKLRDTARTVAEESGVSTLHLALGFLEWFESESSDRPLASPLLLLRVDLDRKIVGSRYQYSITAIGDEAEANQTLSERLTRDYRVKLPDLGEDEPPEAYLDRVQEEVCNGRPRWTVRRFVTLAHFPFARLSMFQDLDDAQWRESLAAHPIVASLLGGEEAGPSLFADEHDIDALQASAKLPGLVLDADASQHGAVYDVMCGKNLVIEGPPGTGKSQTITNVIAAALGAGQRVLFIADKQAALQVVKDRLDKAGLGDFCLELHSGKARKKDVLDALNQRLARRPTSAHAEPLDAKLRDLAATRAALARYADLLGVRFGAQGLTVHDILWADRRRRDGESAEARHLDEIALPACETLSASDTGHRRAVLARFERAAAPVLASAGTPAAHPWFGVTRADLPSVDMEQAVRDAVDAASGMAAVAQAAEALRPYGLARDATLDELGPIAQALATVEVGEAVPPAWFQALAAASLRDDAAAWQQARGAYRQAVEAQAALLALPGGADPAEAADALAEAWSGAAIPALDEVAIDGLPAWAADLRAKAALLAGMDQAAAETASLLGIPAPGSLADISLAAKAVALASDASDQAVEAMTPELMQDGNAAIAGSAAAAIRAARARQSELEAEYSIPPAADPALLRRHAAALAASGLFGFMSKPVKAARLCYAGLLRTPGKMQKPAMVAAMVGIAEHIETLAAFDANQSYRSAIGARYHGVLTDIDAVEQALAWAGQVRSSLPRNDETGVSAALLSGHPDRLRAIRTHAGRADVAALRACLAQFPLTTPSFAALAERLHDQASAAEALAARCQAAGVPPAAPASSLPRLCAALRSTAEAAAAAQPPPSLALALQATCPAPLDDPAPFDAAIRLAAAVAALPLPAPMRDALRQTAPETLRTAAVPAAGALAAALDAALRRWAALNARLGLDEQRFLGSHIGAASVPHVLARLHHAASRRDELGDWILYLQEREAAEALGLADLLRLWDERLLSSSLPDAFDRVYHHALSRAAFGAYPELSRFTGLGQQEARSRFAVLDAEAAALRRQLLADQLGNRPVPPGVGVGKRSEYTDLSLILLERGKQKRHIPIRQLLDRAGNAVQALKPCFMMSPLSVAQYLKPGGLGFDLLVIDEASQMRPEDAIGAVARSGQIVVVGDPKQLPPTSFFARADGPEDDDDEADEEVDAESILDLAQAVFRPMRRLRWHYRSRHGSLVAFSNHEFYDDDLIVFPSPAEAGDGQGVSVVKLDGIYQARSNQAEVDAVCDAAVEHMRTRPGRSLGIATMNQVQRERIAERMDQLATQHPEVEAYRERWGKTLERFFVKNLENVQGDERDVIFISTVFGPATPGGRVLQRFGPINGASGHRRLNVLFTRAKHQLRLFTSLRPEDVTAGPDSPRGARVLKAYLAYAQTGRLHAGTETGREADSDFEVFVRDRLRRAGFDAVPQVGVAGFFIDLAVRDPALPSTFMLGIECDGASYHSSRSARDRDILRQQVLEGLGWTIYRIWSTDWFRDPEGQTRKLLSFIGQLTKGARSTPSS